MYLNAFEDKIVSHAKAKMKASGHGGIYFALLFPGYDEKKK